MNPGFGKHIPTLYPHDNIQINNCAQLNWHFFSEQNPQLTTHHLPIPVNQTKALEKKNDCFFFNIRITTKQVTIITCVVLVQKKYKFPSYVASFVVVAWKLPSDVVAARYGDQVHNNEKSWCQNWRCKRGIAGSELPFEGQQKTSGRGDVFLLAGCVC